MICRRCNWLRGDGCTCPTDEVTARARATDVLRRHAEAVARARLNDYRQRVRDRRRAS